MSTLVSNLVAEEHATPQKPQHETLAMTEEVPRKLSLDGIDEENVDDYHTHLGSTRNDRKEMTRMGKIQELRVGIITFCVRFSCSTFSRETIARSLH